MVSSTDRAIEEIEACAKERRDEGGAHRQAVVDAIDVTIDYLTPKVESVAFAELVIGQLLRFRYMAEVDEQFG